MKKKLLFLGIIITFICLIICSFIFPYLVVFFEKSIDSQYKINYKFYIELIFFIFTLIPIFISFTFLCVAIIKNKKGNSKLLKSSCILLISDFFVFVVGEIILSYALDNLLFMFFLPFSFLILVYLFIILVVYNLMLNNKLQFSNAFPNKNVA